MANPDVKVHVGIDFGVDRATMVAFTEDDLKRFTLVLEHREPVITSNPSLELATFQYDFYLELVRGMFWEPTKFPSVRKGRKKTRRG